MKKIESLQDLKGYTGLVVFSAPWCGPCKGYKPRLEQYAHEHDLHLAEIDASVNKDLAGTYGVRAVPATFYFVNGSPSVRMTGALTALEIASLVP